MKVCRKCGFKGKDSDDFCSKCGSKMDLIDDGYANVSSTYFKQTEIKVSKFPFIVKIVVGIIALLCSPFYRLAGFSCLAFAIVGSIFLYVLVCGIINYQDIFRAFLFFLGSCFFNGHIVAQLLCIIFMAFEIAAGVKIKKKLYL